MCSAPKAGAVSRDISYYFTIKNVYTMGSAKYEGARRQAANDNAMLSDAIKCVREIKWKFN